MNLTEDKSVALTLFGGCDIVLLQGEKVIGEIGAIRWEKENWLRGELYFASSINDFNGELKIYIHFANEYGVWCAFEIRNVIISFPKDFELGKVISFEAKEIVEIEK